MNSVGDTPSDSSLDVVETTKFRNAAQVFHLNILRIRQLLQLGVRGIDASKSELRGVLSKVEASMRDPQSGLGFRKKVVNPKPGVVEVRLTETEIRLIHKAVTWNSELVADLHYNLHNLLCVATWGAFEGYIQAALAELFARHPLLLASEKKITVSEALSAGDGLTEYLIAQEIDDVGRKSFAELQSYIKSKLQIQFSNKHAGLLQEIYFLRNVIAHSAGFVRKDQIALVPHPVEVHEGAVRIETEYLDQVMQCVQEAVRQLDAQLHAKFGGEHKPTLDEMGPHAMLPPKGGARPTRTVDVPTEAEKKGRRGRPRKTGRPGQ
jgi:hypothetical protein